MVVFLMPDVYMYESNLRYPRKKLFRDSYTKALHTYRFGFPQNILCKALTKLKYEFVPPAPTLQKNRYSQSRDCRHIGIMPIPRPPTPPPAPPRLDCPLPKLLPLVLLLFDCLLVVLPAVLLLPLPPPEAFLPPLLKLLRPRNAPRPPRPLPRLLGSLLDDCVRTGGIAGPSWVTIDGQPRSITE